MMRGIAHPTMLKDGSGWGAMAGVAAIEMAAQGFTGAPADTLAPALADLNDRWLIHQQYLKPYACCRWAHPAIDALKSALRLHPIEPARIQIHTFAAGVALSQQWPQNTEQAQYSSRFAIAQARRHPQVLYPQVSHEALSDNGARDWFNKIELIDDPELTARFPEQRFARAVLVGTQGQSFAGPSVQAAADPETPMTHEQIRLKFHAQCEGVLSADATDKIADIIVAGTARPSEWLSYLPSAQV